MLIVRALSKALHFAVALLTLVSAVLALATIGVFYFSDPRWGKQSPLKELTNGRRKSVLFVTAHPDDECMFFGPTIQNLLEHEVYLLCLTNGNFYKVADVRTTELRNSGKLLGLKEENIFTHDNVDLQDDPDAIWSEHKVAEIVETYAKRLNIDVIITFDEGGISGHLNHVGAYNGVKSYILSNPAVKGFKLVSVNLLRKYMSILDVTVTYFSDEPHVFLSTTMQAMTAHDAMFEHKSQMTWYRILYIIFFQIHARQPFASYCIICSPFIFLYFCICFMGIFLFW